MFKVDTENIHRLAASLAVLRDQAEKSQTYETESLGNASEAILETAGSLDELEKVIGVLMERTSALLDLAGCFYDNSDYEEAKKVMLGEKS